MGQDYHQANYSVLETLMNHQSLRKYVICKPITILPVQLMYGPSHLVKFFLVLMAMHLF